MPVRHCILNMHYCIFAHLCCNGSIASSVHSRGGSIIPLLSAALPKEPESDDDKKLICKPTDPTSISRCICCNDMIIVAGWLKKKGPGITGARPWGRRYFKLTRRSLTYYKSMKQKDEMNETQIEGKNAGNASFHYRVFSLCDMHL